MLRLGLGIAVLLSGGLVAPISSGCSESAIVSGGCGVRNDGTSISITDERTVLERRPDTDSRSPIGTPSDRFPSPLRAPLCERSVTHLRLCPKTAAPTEPTTAPPEDPGIPAVTITDLAQFSPAPTALSGEPMNMGIARMSTNFVAPASVITQTGTLFGLPVTVRFTPSGYDFRYGDGTSTTTTTGGSSWAALGLAQFTPTATSHVYRERGTYDASVTVRYTAEVDLGTGWFRVPGDLTANGPTQQIRIFEAHTALVARACTEQPAAPGC